MSSYTKLTINLVLLSTWDISSKQWLTVKLCKKLYFKIVQNSIAVQLAIFLYIRLARQENNVSRLSSHCVSYFFTRSPHFPIHLSNPHLFPLFHCWESQDLSNDLATTYSIYVYDNELIAMILKYTGRPILIDRSKYPLKYAICKKCFWPKLSRIVRVIYLYSWPWPSDQF